MSKRDRAVTIEDTKLYDRITKLEARILQKIQSLKKEKTNYCCKHFENLSLKCELYDPNIDYYDKFWKLFVLNQFCCAKLKESNYALSQLEEKLTAIEVKIKGIKGLFEEHEQLLQGKVIKKSRRSAEQVERNYNCPYPDCFKTYGTEVSLNLHMKTKHNGGNKSDREKAAEAAWQATQNGEPMPNFLINLPPGYLQEYFRNRSRMVISQPNSLQEPDVSPSNDRDRQNN